MYTPITIHDVLVGDFGAPGNVYETCKSIRTLGEVTSAGPLRLNVSSYVVRAGELVTYVVEGTTDDDLGRLAMRPERFDR